MPTKAELEHKIADICRQLQTATEKYTEAQSTKEELQEEVTSRQNALTDSVRERDEALELVRQDNWKLLLVRYHMRWRPGFMKRLRVCIHPVPRILFVVENKSFMVSSMAIPTSKTLNDIHRLLVHW